MPYAHNSYTSRALYEAQLTSLGLCSSFFLPEEIYGTRIGFENSYPYYARKTIAEALQMQNLRFPTPPITPPKVFTSNIMPLEDILGKQQSLVPHRTQSVIMKVGRINNITNPSNKTINNNDNDDAMDELEIDVETYEQKNSRIEDMRELENSSYSSTSSSDADFICQWINCGRIFENLESLASHISQIHAVAGLTDGQYHCHWLGCMRKNRGFNARYKMLVHVRTHTKEKPHQCSFKNCKKSFSRAENLKIHIRSHSGEKPYVCLFEGCQKAYSNSSDRFKHSRTHAIEKPYACKVPGCQKKYTDPSSLRKHVKTFKHSTQIMKNDVKFIEKKDNNIKNSKEPKTSQSDLLSPSPTNTYFYSPHYFVEDQQVIYYNGKSDAKNNIPTTYLMDIDIPLDLRLKRN